MRKTCHSSSVNGNVAYLRWQYAQARGGSALPGRSKIPRIRRDVEAADQKPHYQISERRSRNVAANNILNALFMAVGAGLAGLMLSRNFTVPEVLLAIALVNALVAGYFCTLPPHHLL